MLRPNWALARCGLLRARHTRPAAAAVGPRRATGVRTAMYKHDKPDGTTSTLEWTPKTWATVGCSILGVCGLYGFMMGAPYKVVGAEDVSRDVEARGGGTTDAKRLQREQSGRG